MDTDRSNGISASFCALNLCFICVDLWPIKIFGYKLAFAVA